MDRLQIKKDSKILFIGDSITDVKFNSRMKRKIKGKNVYALQLKKRLKAYSRNIKVEIKGIASNRTYHVYDRLTKDCISLKPDIIIMHIGVNDAWENYVPEQYPPLVRPMEPHFREIFRRINMELNGVQVLYIMPFMIDSVKEKLPFHKTLDEYRKRLREIAEENGAIILDMQEEFNKAQKSTAPSALAIDGIHPTDLGHKVMADAIEKLIHYTGK